MIKTKVLLKGKKLLLLGGGTDMINVTRLAQKMGCIVYILDYYDTVRSPAKLVADEYSDISIFETDKVVEYIKNNSIDGVLTGYTDSYLMQYLNICNQAGLPCYGTEEAFGIATDKMLFKQACIESGVGVIPGTNAYDYDTVNTFAAKNGFPLMIKPTDNSGSRGVIKCEKQEDLKACYEYASSFSKTHNVIIERYMNCDSIGIVYQICDGEAHLSALCDRIVYSSAKTGSAIVSETQYPSKYLSRYIVEVDAQMKQMLQKNGFHDGMVSPMAFVDDKGFYMCEMCYRPSGGHHFTFIDDQNGINGLALLIEYAVTGQVTSYNSEKEDPLFTNSYGMVHILGTPEKTISSINGIDQIKKLPYVLEICEELQPGQTIGRDGTTAQTIASFWIKGNNSLEYTSHRDNVKKLLSVYDANDQQLII